MANPTQRFVFLSSAGQPFPTPVYPPVVGGTSIDSTIKNIYNAIEPWVQWGFEVAAYAVDAVDQTTGADQTETHVPPGKQIAELAKTVGNGVVRAQGEVREVGKGVQKAAKEPVMRPRMDPATTSKR